jgi:hypothetical protein
MLESQIDQEERRRTRRNDARVREQQGGSAYIDHYIQEAGGRFSAHAAATVIGSTAMPQYPAAAAHQRDPVPMEKPLGYSVDAMQHEPLEQFSSFLPAQATDPTSDDAPSHSPLVEVQRAGVGSLSNKRAYRRF